MKLMQTVRSRWAAFTAMLTLMLLGAPLSQAQIVAYDGTNVTFAPASLVTPIATGVIAAIVAGTALFIIFVGVRWVYRATKLSKG